MPSDYKLISYEHGLDYGRKLTSWAQDHLANRYAERTHFIFELLQNAEDALRERGESNRTTSVSFNLCKEGLEVRHFGKQFTPHNVTSICAINESTKRDELTEIGRFGIGFKSVYAVTQRPEVHSGDEHFAIEDFVLPVAVTPRPTERDETLFWIPFRPSDGSVVEEVASALKTLGSRCLLFLSAVNEINWSLPDGTSGVFLKNPPKLSNDGELVTLLGEISGGQCREEEEWLLFSKLVNAPNERPAGRIAIAFLLSPQRDGRHVIKETSDSKLVVFFPTDVPTETGFLIQGPYRTTPSRDNVPANDKWNRKLVENTAELLISALRSLRERGLLDVGALNTLPIDERHFKSQSMFRPLFEQVREALKCEPLLPTFDGRYVSGNCGRLARSEAVRGLFAPEQLSRLLESESKIFWLSDEITKDRAARLREYLMYQVEVDEISPDQLLSRLDVAFLQAQSDQWMRKFYVFLSGQKAILRDILQKELPFLRCDDDTHVPLKRDGQVQAFLPSKGLTGFRTVKRSICSSSSISDFLRQIGLSEPDPVDDVIQNVLKMYRKPEVTRSDFEYASDIERILTAFDTDSENGRRKLIEALKRCYFVRAVAAGSGHRRFQLPSKVYRAKQRLKIVFEGVPDVWLVDDKFQALRGEAVRELLQACGVSDVLRTVPCETSLTWSARRAIRLKAGNEACSSQLIQNDADCTELGSVLQRLPQLSAEAFKRRSCEIWALLRETLHDRREAYFQASYQWSYMHTHSSCMIPATWVRRLQEARWLVDKTGQARAPHEICLSDAHEDIQSAPNAFLAEILGFRPEAIKELAEKEGIDLEALNLLKRHKISAAQLRSLIRPEETPQKSGIDTDEPTTAPLEEQADDNESGESPANEDVTVESTSAVSDNWASDLASASPDSKYSPGSTSAPKTEANAVQEGVRQFYTYVGAKYHSETENDELLSSDSRRELEEAALTFILGIEPRLERTPSNNPGFDLFEGESLEFIVRFVEVKSKKGEWKGGVALSEEQFRLAEGERERYWLYVVEFADDPLKRRLYKIQDPAGKSRYFTFDAGWKALAQE